MTLDDFDLTDPAIQADPFPFYPLLRDERPVFRSELMGRPCWV